MTAYLFSFVFLYSFGIANRVVFMITGDSYFPLSLLHIMTITSLGVTNAAIYGKLFKRFKRVSISLRLQALIVMWLIILTGDKAPQISLFTLNHPDSFSWSLQLLSPAAKPRRIIIIRLCWSLSHAIKPVIYTLIFPKGHQHANLFSGNAAFGAACWACIWMEHHWCWSRRWSIALSFVW